MSRNATWSQSREQWWRDWVPKIRRCPNRGPGGMRCILKWGHRGWHEGYLRDHA